MRYQAVDNEEDKNKDWSYRRSEAMVCFLFLISILVAAPRMYDLFWSYGTFCKYTSTWLYHRKKYTAKCQIRHSYGGGDDDDGDDDIDEELAKAMTENAIKEGNAPQVVLPKGVVGTPSGAKIFIGGQKCKWCGSTTHVRKSHKDCPHNSKKQKAWTKKLACSCRPSWFGKRVTRGCWCISSTC